MELGSHNSKLSHIWSAAACTRLASRGNQIEFAFSVHFVVAFIASKYIAEVNLAWWLAWTSNPVVVHRKVG
jgi:hypothetical protein